MNIPAIKDIVKDNTVYFDLYRNGYFYYTVRVFDTENDAVVSYRFPVSQIDIGDATLLAHDKAIFFMRYIRKAIDEGTFLQQ